MSTVPGLSVRASERQSAGFPVEVGIFDSAFVRAREAGTGNPVYEFTLAPDTVNEGIFCDAPGSRPGSIAWGMTLDPVLDIPFPAGAVVSSSAIYVETTGPELLRLIESLQNLFDVNFEADGSLREG